MPKKNFFLHKERTLVLVKPDGVKRGLVGVIISRFEQRGLKLIALKIVQPTKEHIDEHYPKDTSWIHRLGDKSLATYKEYGIDPKEILGSNKKEEIGPRVREWLVNYLVDEPVVAMIWQGPHVISQVRKIVGPTIPSAAEVGTIRGDFSIDSPPLANLEKRPVLNIVHASENEEEAKKEIEHWFAPEEIIDY